MKSFTDWLAAKRKADRLVEDQRPTRASLTPQQQMLLDWGLSTVRNCASAQGELSQIALILRSDGTTDAAMTDEFDDDAEAFAHLLGHLGSYAQSGEMMAVVILTPMAPEPGSTVKAVMFDLEQANRPRFNVLLLYDQSGGAEAFERLSFSYASPRLFPTQ